MESDIDQVNSIKTNYSYTARCYLFLYLIYMYVEMVKRNTRNIAISMTTVVVGVVVGNQAMCPDCVDSSLVQHHGACAMPCCVMKLL